MIGKRHFALGINPLPLLTDLKKEIAEMNSPTYSMLAAAPALHLDVDLNRA